VLVSDGRKILCWSQTKRTTKWKPQPQLATNSQALVQFGLNSGWRRTTEAIEVKLHWFAERSGVALVQATYNDFFWLDLRTMKIVRWFSDSLMTFATLY
jgi:hypothetical protein